MGIDGYEYGDREVHARDADSSDFSAEQFLRVDDGRDPISRTANMDAATMARRQAILAREDHFGSEDTPADDDFMQVSSRKAGHKKRRYPEEDADSSDFSAEQFLRV